MPTTACHGDPLINGSINGILSSHKSNKPVSDKLFVFLNTQKTARDQSKLFTKQHPDFQVFYCKHAAMSFFCKNIVLSK
jgi:hypothetical protein